MVACLRGGHPVALVYTGTDELPRVVSRDPIALRLLVDDTQTAVIAELKQGEAGVVEITKAVRRSPALVRQALSSLREAGLVRVRSNPLDRRRNLYSVDPRAARAVLTEVASLLGLEAPPAPLFQNVAARPAPSSMSGSIRILSSVPFFSNVAPAELAEIAAHSDERFFKKGEMIFCEGQPYQGLYVVRSGLVKVSKTSPDGKEQVLRLIGPCESFNEIPAFDGGLCPASAQALEDTTMCVISHADLKRLLHRSPAFAGAVIHFMASHMRHLVALVEDLSFRTVTARVAKILLQTKKSDDGVGAGAERRGRLTQQDMAQMAGTAREVVARALKALEQAGAISQKRGRITILDTAKLAGMTCQPHGLSDNFHIGQSTTNATVRRG